MVRTKTTTATSSNATSNTASTTKATKAIKSVSKKATTSAPVTETLTDASVIETASTASTIATASTAPVVDTISPSVIDQFGDFLTKLQNVSSLFSALRTEFRGLERQVARDLKAAAKVQAKRKRKTGNRAPSGFVKPTLISVELATFLGKPEGTEMARTEVTREINAYIREHKLQDKDNGRKIIADKKLTGLLKLNKGDELTYFNLQKYMSPHFAKASDKVASV
jgi:chromatin remodeling complex protein RSC6